jgi:DNA topoisomerase-1
LEVKKGKFGLYAAWGTNNCSLKGLDELNMDEIKLDEIIRYIENSSQDKVLIRQINKDISVRNGKYGHYVYYKTSKMTKPTFHKLQSFNDDYKTCAETVFVKWFSELKK